MGGLLCPPIVLILTYKKTPLSIVASVWEGMITLDWFEGDVRQGRVEGVPELICFASATRVIIKNWMKSADQ